MFDLSRITDLIGDMVGNRSPVEALDMTQASNVLERAGIEASLAEGWVPSNLIDHLQTIGGGEHIPEDIATALEQLGVDRAAIDIDGLQGEGAQSLIHQRLINREKTRTHRMPTSAIKMTAINTAHVEQTRSELQRDVRYSVIERTNDVLNATIDTYLAARHAHWNVRGPAFSSMHDLFGNVASELERQADAIAERIAGLGGIADGTVQSVARDTSLVPYPTLAISQWEHVEAMSMRLGSLATRTTKAAKACDEDGDPVSAHHLIEAAAKIEKLLWLVESHRVSPA